MIERRKVIDNPAPQRRAVGEDDVVESTPPPEAYGRVTDAARFAPLHALADGIVADLERRYDVVRTEGLEVDAELASSHPGCLKVVRLAPRDGRAAPLTVAWSPFPGIHLRMGRWHTEGFPRCGCDACDEQPEELEEELRQAIWAVTAGGLVEELRGDTLRYALVDSRGHRRSGETLVPPHRIGALGAEATIAWDPWTPRPQP